jgi:hypothetical protein
MPKKTDKKPAAVATVPVVVPTPPKPTFEQLAADTEAGRIWDEIKNREIEMFALPDQRVWQHCDPILIEPTKLYLRTRSTSVLPSLETACGKKFEVELVDKYVTVARVVTPLTKR